MTDPRVWFEPIHVSFEITCFCSPLLPSEFWYSPKLKNQLFVSLSLWSSSLQIIERWKRIFPVSLTLNWFSNEGNQGINYCVKHSFPALEIVWQEFLSFVPRCRLHVCPFLPQKKWNGRLNSCCFSARGGRNCQSTRLTFLLSWFSFSIRQSPQNCFWSTSSLISCRFVFV